MKKKSFVLICVLAIIMTVCMSVSVFASDATKYKTVSSYDKNSKTLTFDVYLAGGEAIVGYCSFDYDSDVLTLLDTDSGIVPKTVPDTAEGSSSIYLRSVVKADGDFVITDNGKGSSKLINTDEGYVFFAWFIPSSVAENVDATTEDILIASISFSVKEEKVPDINSVKVATRKLTENVSGWYPGLIVVVNREKVQNHYNGESSGAEFYIAEFRTVGDDTSADTEATEDEEVTPEENKTEDDNPPAEDNEDQNITEDKAEDTSKAPEDKAPDKEENDDTTKTETEDNEVTDHENPGSNDEGTTPETPKENDAPVKDNDKTETDSGNAGKKEEKKEKTPAFAQRVDFSLKVNEDTETAQVVWVSPESLEPIDSFAIVLLDKNFDTVTSVSGITPTSNKYTFENLYGGTEYKVYLIAKAGNKQYVSHVTCFTTKSYTEVPPPIASLKVTYDRKGVYLYGFDSEDVLYGGHVSKNKIPKVTPKDNSKVFLGWSVKKDSNTVIDIGTYKVYKDTVFYPVLADEKKEHESYINGYSDGTFKPTGNITRAEAAVLISRIHNKYDENKAYTHDFTDCKDGMWFNHAVAFCYALDFIRGYNDGTFNPSENIKRAEFATILYRVFEFKDVVGLNVFADLDGHWAESYVSVLYEAGIVKPDKDGNFRPNEKLTRQDAVRMINGCLGIIPDRNAIDTEISANGYIFSDVPHYSEYYYDIMAAVLG